MSTRILAAALLAASSLALTTTAAQAGSTTERFIEMNRSRIEAAERAAQQQKRDAKKDVTLNEQLGCDRLLELSSTTADNAMECARVKERSEGGPVRCLLYGVGMYALNQPEGIIATPKPIRKAMFKACIMVTHNVSEAMAEKVYAEPYAMMEHSSFIEENELYREIGQAKAKQAAEVQRKKNAVLEAEQAKVQALPVNRLLNGYMAFGYVRFCHEDRRGYLIQYVNDFEMQKATTAVKAIVAQTTKEEPSLNTDQVWQEAQSLNARRHLNEGMCREALMDLFRRSPVALQSTAKP